MGSLNIKTVIARTNESKWKTDKLKTEKSFKTVAGNLIYPWNKGRREWWLLPCVMLSWAGADASAGHAYGPPHRVNQGNASAHRFRKVQPDDLMHYA